MKELARAMGQLTQTVQQAHVASNAQVQQLAQLLGQTAQERQGANPRGDSRSLSKHFSKLDKFDGKDEAWKEWHFHFVTALGSYDVKAAETLEAVLGLVLAEATSEALEFAIEGDGAAMIDKLKGELYAIIGQYTTGEANVLVRSVDDRNGFVAMKRLYDRYNPRTPASLTQAWMEVVKPKRAKDIREAGRAIDLWEQKVAVLKREHGEEPTTGLKAAVLLMMLPENVHLTVAQGMESAKLDFDALKAKVKLMAAVQIDRVTPKPMDIGEMRRDQWSEDEEEEQWEEAGVMAVGESCHRCGGVGHYARECPTAKGKGRGPGKGQGGAKGGTGKGKGAAPAPTRKGGGKAKGCFNCGGNHFARECPKGNSKGAKGVTCFTCGGRGHRAAQCPSHVSAVEQEEDGEQEEVGVHNVWRISEVKSTRGGTPMSIGRWRKKMGAVPSYAAVVNKNYAAPVVQRYSSGVLSHTNRFSALQAEDDDDDEDPGKWIQDVGVEDVGKWVGTTEIIVDSAADESVCPWEWAKPFKTREVPVERQMKLKNASGGRIQHWGEKQVNFVAGDRDSVMGMDFQVCDVQRPLAAVCRIVEKGNIVRFGPRVEDNYIMNPETQEKIMLRRKGRSFVLDAELVKPKKGEGFAGQGS